MHSNWGVTLGHSSITVAVNVQANESGVMEHGRLYTELVHPGSNQLIQCQVGVIAQLLINLHDQWLVRAILVIACDLLPQLNPLFPAHVKASQVQTPNQKRVELNRIPLCIWVSPILQKAFHPLASQCLWSSRRRQNKRGDLRCIGPQVTKLKVKAVCHRPHQSHECRVDVAMIAVIGQL